MIFGLLPTKEDKATLGSDLSALWDFAESMCSLYLRLTSPAGDVSLFMRFDKIRCLPLTKYIHFWMTE